MLPAQKSTYKDLRRERNPDRKRHGARNQHKMKHFVKWLLQHFPRQLLEATRMSPIVDVAGGKGELAARLCVCHDRNVVVVDPRPCDPLSCFRTVVLPKVPNKWQEKIKQREEENANFLEGTFQERFTQLVMPLDDRTVVECEALQNVLQQCCLLIGLHADGATEAIVDVALAYNKPFVVVPCCVFPNLFQDRRVEENGSMVQVRTYEQFCRYLVEKDSRFQLSSLPFEGRNIAIWWEGS